MASGESGMERSRSTAWLRGIAAAVGLLAACAHAPASPTEPVSPPGGATLSDAERSALAGTWVYSGGEAELAQVDPAVERAIADMGFLARGFAAEALRARARPRDLYALAF